MKRYRPVLFDYATRRVLLVISRPGRKVCAIIKWVPFSRIKPARLIGAAS